MFLCAPCSNNKAPPVHLEGAHYYAVFFGGGDKNAAIVPRIGKIKISNRISVYPPNVSYATPKGKGPKAEPITIVVVAIPFILPRFSLPK